MQVLMQDIRTAETTAVAVGFHEDVRPLQGAAGRLDWLLCGALSRLILDGRVTGALGDVALLTTAGKIPASKIFMIGLGRSDAGSPETLRTAARTAAESLVAANVDRTVIDLFPEGAPGDEAPLHAVAEELSATLGRRGTQVQLHAADQAMFERLSRALKK